MNKRKIIALVLAATAVLGCAAPVSALDTAHQAALQSLGVIGTSNYAATATRGEFARMLVAVSGRADQISSTASSSPFSDVPYSSEYAGYIAAVTSEGTMSGYLDGTFRPYDSIRMEEAVSAALNLLGYTGGTLTARLAQARSLGLLSGINRSQGETMTVEDCAQLLGNLLTTPTSEGQNYAAKVGVADASGNLDYTAAVTSGLQGPYLCTNSPASILPFSTERIQVYLNGSAASLSDLDQYDLIYYNANMQTVWAYRNRVTGVYTAASPSTSAPTSVTVAGQTYNVTGSAAYTLSDLGGMALGSTVTLLLDRNGSAAFALSGSHTAATSVSEMAGVVTGVQVSSYTDLSGKEVFDYTASVICADGVLRSYPVSSAKSFSEGDLVRITNGLLTEVDKCYLNGTFNSSGTSVAGYSLSSDAQVLDYLDSGSYQRIYSSSLGNLTLSRRNVLYYHLNSNGQIDVLILKNATGDVGSYGLVTNVTAITQPDPETPEGEEPEEIVVGYTVTYLLNGQTSTVTLDADATVTRGGVLFKFKNGQLTGTTSLRKVTATRISGLTATTASGAIDIADDVAVYVKMDNQYVLTSLATVSDSYEYDLSCYYDGSASSGKVRVIVAEEK